MRRGTEFDKKGFINYFRALPEDPKILRVFNRKDFFSVHGDDATFVARTFYKTTTVVKYLGHGESALAGVTLNKSLFETVLRDLLLEGTERTVELYEEIPRQGWRLAKSASPGKLGAFEDELYRGGEIAEAPVVAAVRVAVKAEQRHVGVAYVNPTTRELGACEFVDDEQFCALEAVICQLGAKECVVPAEASPSPEGRRLRDVVARGRAGHRAQARGLRRARPGGRPRAPAREARRARHDARGGRRRRGGGGRGGRREAPRAPREGRRRGALAAALRFSELLADPANHGRCRLSMHDTGRYVRLDSSALRALNVLPERTSASASAAAPAGAPPPPGSRCTAC